MKAGDDRWNRYGLWYALAAFVAIRALILIVAYAAPQDRVTPRSGLWWSPVPTARWDAGHYLGILQNGYPIQADGRLPGVPRCETVAFFPGYPLLAWPLTRWMSPDAALVALTHAAAFLAAVFLYLWARRRYDGRIAFWCVVLLSVYPPAMFFSAGYADGLLVLWVALALWLLEHQRIWAAAAASALATATRPTGLCLAAVVVLWFVLYGPRPPWPRRQQNSVQDPARTRRECGWASWWLRLTTIGFVSIAGLIAFQLYLWHYYDRPDAFVAVQNAWKPSHEPTQRLLRLATLKPVIQPALRPIKHTARGLAYLALWRPEESGRQLRLLLDPGDWNPVFNLVLLVAAMVGLCRPGRVPRVLYLLPILVFLEAYLPDPYCGTRMIGIARYQLMALPAFLLLASGLCRPRLTTVRYVLCAGLLALQCVYIGLFVNWVMVG